MRAFFYGATLGYESFDRGWLNEPYFDDFSEAQLKQSTLGVLGTEDFETNWSNVPFVFDWSGVTAATASFDGEPFEDFEELWSGNENYARDWSRVTSVKAYFDAGVSPQETFEGGWPLAFTQ